MKIKVHNLSRKDLIQETSSLLIIYIGVPLIILAICAIVFVIHQYHGTQIAVITIQNTIHEQCNLESYRAESRYYDSYPGTSYYHELHNGKTTIHCDLTVEGWQCVCDETE
jgi:hypothetical protein